MRWQEVGAATNPTDAGTAYPEVLPAGLYARRHSGRELLMVYVCFNVGLFAALTSPVG
ncbi:MAG TPA: hypothetical protein VF657_09410 [Actinoplanes sp.]|jgi:hypothetical protein